MNGDRGGWPGWAAWADAPWGATGRGQAGRGDAVRLSDAERDEAAQALHEHFAQGRLTAEEHAERTDQVLAAKTYADLPPLFGDLPGGSPLHPAAPVAARGPAGRSAAYAGRRPSGPGFGGILRFALMVLVVVAVLTHLPFILLGLAVWFLLVAPRIGRGHRVGHRAWSGHGYRGSRGWAA